MNHKRWANHLGLLNGDRKNGVGVIFLPWDERMEEGRELKNWIARTLNVF